MKRKPNMPFLVGFIVCEVVAAVLAWRDLDHRSDRQVPGTKTAWRVFISLNPGNSFGYWAFGRR